MEEGKKKRTMTPEMLEKLAVARAKAMEVRRQLKAEKDAKELEELPAKLEQKAKIKAELEKPKAKKPETRTQKTIPEDNPVMDSPDTDSDDYSVDFIEPPPVKQKKKKKQIVVVEDSSSDDEQYIYVPKRRTKGVPQNPKATYVPEEHITPAQSVQDYSVPPQPPPPPQPRQPTYNELARANLHTFGAFPRRF